MRSLVRCIALLSLALVAGVLLPACGSRATVAPASETTSQVESALASTYQWPNNAACPSSATATCKEAKDTLDQLLTGFPGNCVIRTLCSDTFGGGGAVWHDANTVEAILDYYAATGDASHLPTVASTVPSVASSGITGNGYLDDRLWWALTLIRAYDVLPGHPVSYLSDAKAIFQGACGQWNAVPGCYGGLPQVVGDTVGGNTITNELFFETAAKLALRSPNDAAVCSGTVPWTSASNAAHVYPGVAGASGSGGMSNQFPNTYLGWALAEYEFFKQNQSGLQLYDVIQDGLDPAPSCKPTSAAWTYNQGPILGALLDLSYEPGAALAQNGERDPPAKMLSTAYRIASNAMVKLSVGGILTEPNDVGGGCAIWDNGDCAQFKGVFVRYLGRLMNGAWPTPDTGYIDFNDRARAFLTLNASTLWAHRAGTLPGHAADNAQSPENWSVAADLEKLSYQPAMTSGVDALVAAIPVQGPPAPPPLLVPAPPPPSCAYPILPGPAYKGYLDVACQADAANDPVLIFQLGLVVPNQWTYVAASPVPLGQLYAKPGNTYLACTYNATFEGGVSWTGTTAPVGPGVLGCDPTATVIPPPPPPPACQPKTCGFEADMCGAQSDGCGGTIVCPGCPSGEYCDSMGFCASRTRVPAPAPPPKCGTLGC